jgi:signal transduction histidine kinase/CheY-like chemotaxis protein
MTAPVPDRAGRGPRGIDRLSGLWYRMSLSARVAVTALALAASVLVISGAAGIAGTRQALRSDLDAYGGLLADALAVHAAGALASGRHVDLQAHAERLVQRRSGVRSFIVAGASGRPVAAAVAPREPGVPLTSLRSYVATVRSPSPDGGVIGSVTLQLSAQDSDALLQGRTRRLLLETGCCLLALVACVGMLLKSSVGGPLRGLGEQASRLAHGDLDSPIALRGQSEFARLASIMDGMRLRVREQIERLQQVTDELGREIVDRSRAEAALREANRYKSEFLARMSHDLRTPMTAILGYADLLSRGTHDPERVAEWAAAVQDNGDHLLSLLNDILDLSKIEAGQMPLTLQPCSPLEVVDEVAGLMRPRAAEKLLELRVVCAEWLPVEIETDPLRLRQILTNLVSNAVKFTDLGSVEIRVESVRPEDGPCRLRVEVEDTGIGIPKEQLGRIFEPFTQGDVPSRGGRGGTGLGLDISRRLAAMLNGTITVRSRPGEGSVFALELEIGDAAGLRFLAASEIRARRVGVDPRSDAAGRLDRRRLLVVDDNPDNQRIITFLLEETGAEVDVVADGRAAIDAVMQREDGRPHDLIVMDMQMPVMDGYAATAALRERGVEVPIVALTAHAMTGDRERCLRVGCNEYVSKPIVPDVLFAAIDRQLSAPGQPPSVTREPGGGPPASLAGDPRLATLVAEYAAALPALADEIDAAVDAEDDRLGVLLHRLKGTAANYGFPELTEAARRAEATFKSGGFAPELEAMVEQVTKRLRAAPARRSA